MLFENNKLTIIFLVMIAFVTLSTKNTFAASDYFEKGIALSEKNDGWKTTLNYWIQVKDSLDRIGKHDPRVGFEFIRVVTENEATEYYDLATNFYYWGLRTTDFPKYEEAITEEVERIQPIISDDRYLRWTSLIEDKNPSIFNHIRGFWTDRDMTPTQLTNERLLEHWERIAYSKEYFRRNTNTVYKTDDRALIYVKYGPPTRKRTGTLTVNRFQLENWAEDMIIASGQGLSSTGTDSTITSGLTDHRGRQNDMKSQLVQLAEQIHEYSEFEVWVYDAITDSRSRQRSIIYIFGSSPSLGSYGLRRSLDEFIPSRAYTPRRSQFGTTHMNPAILLQLSYYQQLMATDDYFGDRFVHLENDAISTQRRSSNLARIQSLHNANELRDRQFFGPREFSNYEQDIKDIELNYELARFLDEDNQPILFAFVYSRPFEIIYTDLALTQEISVHEPDYRLLHNIRSRSSDYNTLANLNAEPTIDLEYDPVSDGLSDAMSFFIIPYDTKEDNIRLAVQLQDVNRPSSKRDDNIFNQSLLGINNLEIETPEHLEFESGEFAMSDVLIGYGGADLIDLQGVSEAEDITIPFYVPYEKKIPKQMGLRLLFETYNISTNDHNVGEYTVEYQLRTYGLFGRVRQRGATRLTLNFTSFGDRARDILEIDLQDIDPGKYNLYLNITDTKTGKSVSTERDIEIVDINR